MRTAAAPPLAAARCSTMSTVNCAGQPDRQHLGLKRGRQARAGRQSPRGRRRRTCPRHRPPWCASGSPPPQSRPGRAAGPAASRSTTCANSRTERLARLSDSSRRLIRPASCSGTLACSRSRSAGVGVAVDTARRSRPRRWRSPGPSASRRAGHAQRRQGCRSAPARWRDRPHGRRPWRPSPRPAGQSASLRCAIRRSSTRRNDSRVGWADPIRASRITVSGGRESCRSGRAGGSDRAGHCACRCLLRGGKRPCGKAGFEEPQPVAAHHCGDLGAWPSRRRRRPVRDGCRNRGCRGTSPASAESRGRWRCPRHSRPPWSSGPRASIRPRCRADPGTDRCRCRRCRFPIRSAVRAIIVAELCRVQALPPFR